MIVKKSRKAIAANSTLTGKKKRVIGRPFRPGESGNPNGRPVVPASVVEASRALTGTALATLEEICISGIDESARIKAAVALLDRAWGKPIEKQELTGKDQSPLEVRAVSETLTDEQRVVRIQELFAMAQARRDAGQLPKVVS